MASAAERRERWQKQTQLSREGIPADTERIRAALEKAPRGLKRSEITRLFGGSRQRSAVRAALSRLATDYPVSVARERTAGRPAERWSLRR